MILNEGTVNVFFSEAGTDGTITGVGEVQKARRQEIQVIAVEPDASPVLSGGKKGPYPIQGFGVGFVPKVLNTTIYDEVMRVKTEEAFTVARRIRANLRVVIVSSFGERYLSTQLFAHLEV